MQMQFKHFFDASHQLPDTDYLTTKGCANLHGHTYAVKVNISNVSNSRSGMIIDFNTLKKEIDVLDHTHINNVFEQFNIIEPTTAENIAKFILQLIQKHFFGDEIIEVWVCEGYKGEEKASWVGDSNIE